MTQADVRCQYLLDLWRILDGLQRTEDEETEKFFLEHEELRNDPVYAARREFVNELFDSSDVDMFANVFRLWPPEHFAITGEILDVVGCHGLDDMVWCKPHVSVIDGRLCIEVMLIDRPGY